MELMELINQFGPWGIIAVILGWQMKTNKENLEADRQERVDESKRHQEEVSQLRDVIQNNTIALVELKTFLTGKEEE